MKKIMINVLVILAASSFIHGCTKEEPPYAGPVERMTIAAYAGDSGVLVYIAENQGYFKENGLDVTIKDYGAGKLTIDALLAGQADISTATEFAFVSNSFDNPDLRVIGTIATARICELVARKDHGINKPEDLKGKKIGITKKSRGEFSLGGLLAFNSLSMDDIEIVDMKPRELVNAIAQGRIDAALTWDPYIYNIKARLGESTLAWPEQIGQGFHFILITKEDWIKNHFSATRRLLKSLLQAENFVKSNVSQVKELIKGEFYYESGYVDYGFHKHDFVVKLPQTLLLAMEGQARWRIKNNLTDKTGVPNYLDYLYLDGLKALKPEAVTVIH